MVNWIQKGHSRSRDLKLTNREAYEYLLGAFQGDGTAGSNGSLSYTVDSRNIDYIKSLASTLEYAFQGCKPKIRYEKKGNIARVILHSVNIVPLFRQYKKDYVWSLPSLSYIKSYLAGIIDTDGCIQLRKNTAYCTITQKTKSNILLLAKLFDSLGIRYRLNLDYKYTNSLGNFERSELIIRHKDEVTKILDFPYKNPVRIEKVKSIRTVYRTLKRKRPNGELEDLILFHLDQPKTLLELQKVTGCTNGNLNYKVLRMNTIKRKMVNNVYVYSKE